ncbi:MAG TPA: hypothetical protein VK705_12310 [Ferruginibacter sp.]|jgi:hypothetical protein|nr:hypothetical protein [Ferruginibacter sp.]
MKIIKGLSLLIIASFAIAICSCRKDHNNGSTTTSSLPKYEKRWNITGVTSHRPALSNSAHQATNNTLANRPSDTAANYSAIEFLINSYVIFFADGTVQAGQYTVTSDTSFVLDSVGTIHITSITSAAFSFTITPLDGATPISLTADAADASGAFTSPADIAFVTTTWTLDSAKFYLPVDSSDYYFDTSVVSTYVTFSEYGTYLKRFIHSDGQQEYQTNTWLWSNTGNSQFCYGNWDGQNITNCNGLESANIISYPSPYTKLVIEQTDPTDPLCFYLSKH